MDGNLGMSFGQNPRESALGLRVATVGRTRDAGRSVEEETPRNRKQNDE